MKKFLVLSLALALAAGSGFAQECPGKAAKDCGSAKECDSKATLASRIDQLEQGAAKGCEKSQAKLDTLVKAADPLPTGQATASPATLENVVPQDRWVF